MNLLGIAASVVLGLLFLIAGFSKLRDGPAWPLQAADMGTPRPIALAVPWIELSIGILLLVRFRMPWTAVASAALLAAFTVVIAVRLLDGSRPPCACFGSRSKKPLGAFHVLRNLGMLAMAALAIVGT